MTAAASVPADADVPALREAATGCRGCEPWEPATQVVFSAGNDRALLGPAWSRTCAWPGRLLKSELSGALRRL